MKEFKEKLRRGEALVGAIQDLAEPSITELIGNIGYDFIWLDTEHSATDYQTLLMQIIAARAAGAASVVRIPSNGAYLAKRVLEMGPDGIIFPMIQSAEEAKRAMDACIYPPDGARGFGPLRAAKYGIADLTEYIANAADSFCRFIQVESRLAVRNLDEILAVSHIDGVIIGPCDLSGSIGRLNHLRDPENLALIDETISKCRSAGVPVGIAVGENTEARVRFWVDRGIQFVACGNDYALFAAAEKQAYDEVRRAMNGTKRSHNGQRSRPPESPAGAGRAAP